MIQQCFEALGICAASLYDCFDFLPGQWLVARPDQRGEDLGLRGSQPYRSLSGYERLLTARVQHQPSRPVQAPFVRREIQPPALTPNVEDPFISLDALFSLPRR